MLMKKIIELKNIHKSFNKNEVVKGIDLDVAEGEFLTLLGPSGCGKTTTLRMIAGFEEATAGSIFIDEEDVGALPPYKRKVNTVFQNYALFPHMNVFNNVAYPLSLKKLPKKEIKEKVFKALDIVQLTGFEKRKTGEMSGGQKQRVAIARAIVGEPKVLLLDEPLGALDFKLRKQMQVELKRLQRQLGITFVYVTHDQEEAMTMSDRIAVMNGGVIEQIGTPDDVYNKPESRFVADFIGESNLIPAKCKKAADGIVCFDSAFGEIAAAGSCGTEARFLCIRPEYISAHSQRPAQTSERNVFPALVTDNIFTGNLIKTIVKMEDGSEMRLSCMPEKGILPAGSKVYLSFAPSHCVMLEQ